MDGIRAEFGQCGVRTENPLSARSAPLSLSPRLTLFHPEQVPWTRPEVAAWLQAGAGVWTKTKAGAVRGAEPAAAATEATDSRNRPPHPSPLPSIFPALYNSCPLPRLFPPFVFP